MREIKMMRGIPASGKSTWAKQFLAENPRFKRINKDSFRRMLIGDNWDVKIEKVVHQLQEQAIETLLGKGFSVLLDNTHLKEKYFTEICDLAQRIGNVGVTEKWFDVPLDECLKRNSTRLGVERVPEDIVRKMYASIKDISKAERTIYFPKVIKTFERNDNLPECVVSDLDGTLFLNESGRSPFAWKLVGNDSLNVPVAEILDTYKRNGIYIILMSGRDSCCREETEKCLDKYKVHYDYLYMRETNDNRADEVIKKELYEKHIKNNFNIKFWLDDRNKVVRMLRDNNITVLQCNDGNF